MTTKCAYVSLDTGEQCGKEFEQTDGMPLYCAESIAEIEAERKAEHQAWMAKTFVTNQLQKLRNTGVDEKHANGTLGLFTFWKEGGGKQQAAERSVMKRLEAWANGDMSFTKNSVFIHGEPGLGKTHLTQAALVRAFKNTGESAKLVTFEQVLKEVRRTFDAIGKGSEEGERDEDVINRYARDIHWLVIDDLGASEKSSDFSLRVMYEIMQGRLKNNLPTLLTSNLALPDLLERIQPKDKDGRTVGDDIEATRIIDRIREMCDVMKLVGDSYRR